MRVALAGIWLLASVGAAMGQAEGRVEGLGFAGYYRTNCWTPLRIALRPTTGNNEKLRLIVVQEDLDRDPVSFVQEITLTGGTDASRREQRFWTYFMPQPSGLPETTSDLGELAKKLRVYLATANGTRLMQLGFSNPALNPLDGTQDSRGRKLVLIVRDAARNLRTNMLSGARGITEEITFVEISPADLPDNVVGYRAVDAIVWSSANPATPAAEPGIHAMQEWLREGGRFVVLQDPNKCDSYSSGAFGQMMPVTLNSDSVQYVKGDVGLTALRELGQVDDDSLLHTSPFGVQVAGRWTYYNPWRSLMDHTFPIACASRVKTEAGAYVELWADDQARVPYLVRWRFGAGCVTWVAQDLGASPAFDGKADDPLWYGWSRIWDRIFDWPHDTVTQAEERLAVAGADARWKRYVEGFPQDLSAATLSKMELTARGGALVTLAVFFFIIYWIVAGPGTYMALLRKKLASLNWPAYAVWGVAATGLTVLMVGWILRGKPQARHLSVVRIGPDDQAVIHSQIGLFIPRDGEQRIEMRDTDPRRESSIVAYPMHRKFAGEGSGFLASREYEVRVPRSFRDTTDPAPGIRAPYRSTMKKFQAKWAGAWKGNIAGQAKLVEAGADPRVAGRLTNNLGIDLRNVYLVYRTYSYAPIEKTGSHRITGAYDHIVFMPQYRADGVERPAWANGETIDLTEVFKEAAYLRPDDRSTKAIQRDRAMGFLRPRANWPELRWYGDIRGRMGHEGVYTGSGSGALDRVMTMMALFDRIPPSEVVGEETYRQRPELSRRAGRQFDVSSAIAAGNLVILAGDESETTALPFGLDVEGDRVAGEGATYYQVIVPIDRTSIKPATRPAKPPPTTRSATQRSVLFPRDSF